MQFNSFSDFIAMGGYGFYVWLSVGVSIAALVLLVISTQMEKKRLIMHIKREAARKHRMRKARQTPVISQNPDGISNESQT